jgi:hypothetical protein
MLNGLKVSEFSSGAQNRQGDEEGEGEKSLPKHISLTCCADCKQHLHRVKEEEHY